MRPSISSVPVLHHILTGSVSTCPFFSWFPSYYNSRYSIKHFASTLGQSTFLSCTLQQKWFRCSFTVWCFIQCPQTVWGWGHLYCALTRLWRKGQGLWIISLCLLPVILLPRSDLNHRILIVKPQDKHTHTHAYDLYVLAIHSLWPPCWENIAGYKHKKVNSLYTKEHRLHCFLADAFVLVAQYAVQDLRKHHKISAGLWMYPDQAKYLLNHSIITIKYSLHIFISS